MIYFNNLLKKYLNSFFYFYKYLGYRIFVLLALSILVGILDGFGLAMFIPLLEFTSVDGINSSSQEMGKLIFLVSIFDSLGISFTLTAVLLIMLSFFLLKGLAKFFEGYKQTVYLQYFVRNLREENILLLANYRYREFVNSDVGRIQNTMTGEIGRVVNGYSTYMGVIKQIMLLFVYTTLAFLSNPQFTLLVMFGGFLTNLMFNKLFVKTKNLSRQLTIHNHGFQGLVIQQVAQFKYLKATGLIRDYASKLINRVYKIEKAQRKIGIISASINGVREPLMMSVVVMVILLQVKVFGGSLASIILSILFFYRALGSIMSLQTEWNRFLSVTGSLENVSSFTEELSTGKEYVGMKKIDRFYNSIELQDVSFSYQNTPTLKDICLSIHKNETIAFVGESGSGKTTLLNIICGLLEPDKGNIMVDHIPFTELNITSLQRRIGYITQEPVIFNDTIFNNVTFWSKKTNENIVAFHDALQKANILQFVNNLPKQHDTILGNNGINLSGGQKQRISIARELFKNVDFLFMDEATSSLDSETETQIQSNIELLHGQYTILIIAHRLSTIKNADRVVVLDEGRIQKIGTYTQLLSESNSFKRMVELQHI